MKIQNQETGRSLVEMLCVIGIISILTVGVMSTVQYGMTSYRAEAMHTTIEYVANGTADIYSWSRAYPTSDDDSMAKRIIDNNICDNCTRNGTRVEIPTTWGHITVEPVNESYFQITTGQIPTKVCEYLSESNWQIAIPEDHINCEGADGYMSGITFTVN